VALDLVPPLSSTLRNPHMRAMCHPTARSSAADQRSGAQVAAAKRKATKANKIVQPSMIL